MSRFWGWGDIVLGHAHHRGTDAWIGAQLHDEVQGEPVIRPTKEGQEQVGLLAYAEWCSADEECDVCPSVRKDTAHEVRVGRAIREEERVKWAAVLRRAGVRDLRSLS
jgi:hypothetical protein